MKQNKRNCVGGKKKMVVIDIEDYWGNTLCALRVEKGKITKTHECNLVDIDEDIWFDTDDERIRIRIEDWSEKAKARGFGE